MRILIVTAYVSADGSYGGPVTVALDQATALHEAGHEVTVAAGWDGADPPGHSARLRLFRARKPLRRSFVGLVAPQLLGWVARHAGEFDVVHVHVTRDLVTLPAARLAQRRGVPVVLQTHGQIRPDPGRLQAAIDVLLTRRVFRDTAAFLVLTAHEEQHLCSLGVERSRLHRVDNGVPGTDARAEEPGKAPLLLFSSRVAGRKRPEAFVAAAEIVARHRPDARFEVWGPDGGALSATVAEIERRGLSGRCVYRGAATREAVRGRLAKAAVFMLPSFAEPFPVALLEAFAAGLPAVITDQTGLSKVAAEAGAALVTDGSPQQLADAALQLLGDDGTWERTADAALRLAGTRFAMPRIADRLLGVYGLIEPSLTPSGGR